MSAAFSFLLNKSMLTFDSYAAMQSYAGTLTANQTVWLVGYDAASAYKDSHPRGGGMFMCLSPSAAIGTVEDGGTICEAANSQFLYRIIDGFVTPEMFGAHGTWQMEFGGDSGPDDAPPWRRLVAYLNGVNRDAHNLPCPTVIASGSYAVRTADAVYTDNTVVMRFSGPSIPNISGGGGLYFYNSTNAVDFDSIMQVDVSGFSLRDFTVHVSNCGGKTFDKIIHPSGDGGFYANMVFDHVSWGVDSGVTTNNYGFYGIFWGSLLSHCTGYGAQITNYAILSATSIALLECYSNGSQNAQMGFKVGGWYSTITGGSSDNIANGYAYFIADREWSCMSLGTEGSSQVLWTNCDQLIVNGINRITGTALGDPITVVSGVARLYGLDGVGPGPDGKTIAVQNGLLYTDLPETAIKIADGSGNDLGFSTKYLSLIHSDAVAIYADAAPSIGSYPFAGGYVSTGQLNNHHDELPVVPVWTNHTAALNSYVQATAAAHPTLVFKCTTAGATGSNQPSWDTTIGHVTTDGSAHWTTEALNTDGFGPIVRWHGPGALRIYGGYGNPRCPLRFTAPLVMLDNSLALSFQALDFFFDLADVTKDCIQLYNCPNLTFDDCTFTFQSGARCLFGGYDTVTAGLQGNAKVTMHTNCTVNSGLTGVVVGGTRYYKNSSADISVVSADPGYLV